MDDHECRCRPPRKSDRLCNNPDCRKRLTDDAPNWFQCSYECMRVVWVLNHPPEPDNDR